MAFEVPHKHDISLDGQEMRNQMIENFEAIEHEDQQDDQALVEEIQDRGDADKKLDGKITTEAKARKAGDDNEARDRRAADTKEAQNREIADGKLDNRLNRLDQEKATHDDVNDLRGEMYQIRDDWHDRASHIARGTDVETTKAVVEQILQEKGLI